MTSQHNNAEFQKIILKFGVSMKNGFSATMNDKISGAIVRSILVARARKRQPITGDSVNSNKGAISKLMKKIVEFLRRPMRA